MTECLVCGGDRHVKIHLRRRIPVSPMATRPSDEKAEVSYRTFPCPECQGKQAGEETVVFVGASGTLYPPYDQEPGAKEAVFVDLATSIALHLLDEKLILFREEVRGGNIEIAGRLSVVSPIAAISIERRAFEMIEKFLGWVESDAAAAITSWNSSYAGREGPISKDQAIRFMSSSFAFRLLDIKRHLEADASR